MYDDRVVMAFIKDQLKLYPEIITEDIDEAREFLEDSCAVVADSPKDVCAYLEDVGVDTEGISREEICSLPEVFAVGDGRYLIMEI